MSDLEIKPIHKIFRVRFSSIKFIRDTNTDVISLHQYNNSTYKIILSFLGLLGYCRTNAKSHPTQARAFRFEKNLKLLDTCQPRILNE